MYEVAYILQKAHINSKLTVQTEISSVTVLDSAAWNDRRSQAKAGHIAREFRGDALDQGVRHDRIHPSSSPHPVQPARRRDPGEGPVPQGQAPRNGYGGGHRSRQHV